MKISEIAGHAVLAMALCALAACQTGGSATSVSDAGAAAVGSEGSAEESTAEGGAIGESATGPAANDVSLATTHADAAPTAVTEGEACAMVLTDGPPQKPAKGADFGAAAAKNTGKLVQRGAIQQAAGYFGGGLGAAIGGAVAKSTIRDEQDIKGIWMITDGAPTCACKLKIDGLFNMQGRGKDTGSIAPEACKTPAIAQMANWALGYSFTGYDAKFELKAKDKRTVLATLNRDGMHYFSGALADGTPITLWREGQNYMQMKARGN
jgi:hypothetical protein